MNRMLSLALLCVYTGVALADEPAGMIVIRPKAPATSAADYAPDKPGFIVIRPGRMTKPADKNPILISNLPPTPSTPTAPLPVKRPDAEKPAETESTPETGKITFESWDALFLKGSKVGHFHTVVREYERDGKKYLYGVKTQNMTIARFGQIFEQWAEDATMETLDGEVLVTRMRQGIGRDQKLCLSGKVVDKKLVVKIEGAAGGEQTIPWPEGVVGIAREATLIRDQKPKVGDTKDYLYYEGRLNRVIKVTIAVKEGEEITIYEGEKPRKTLRVEQSMEAIQNFRLPTMIGWYDAATYDVLKIESDIPSLGGRMTVVRTTKEAALRPVGKVPDLFDIQSIALNRTIDDVHGKRSITYRVKLSGDIELEKAFAQDDRQIYKEVDAKNRSFLFTTKRLDDPAKQAKPTEAGNEFLGESFFIDWNCPEVKRHTKEALAGVGESASSLTKARKIETWVNTHMKSAEFSQAMASCGNVAKNLTGDCTEYAMLAAGMCRAAGIPSRTAIGLVYAQGRDGKPFLAYHMWYEIYTEGKWYGLDATLGRGAVGPGHVKITDSSWHDERSFTPLLPVLNVIGGSPKFEILEVEGR